MLNPWILLGALLAALGSFGAGYWYGSGNAKTQCVANEVQSQSAAVKEAATESARREGVSAAREASGEQIRIVYRTLREQATARREDLVVAASGVAGGGCELAADSLQLWNAANSGTAPPLRGELDRGVSRAAASAVGEVGRFAGQPYRGDGAGGTVSGSVEQVGGMHQQTRPAEGSAP